MSILTGFTELDRLTGGLAPGELTVIAGRPGMGKTALCWSLAKNITQNGAKVCVVALAEGVAGNFTHYNVHMQSHHFCVALENLKGCGFDYDVIIFTAIFCGNNTTAKELYSSLKTFAVNENVAVVVETHTNRKTESLEDKRPALKHIRNHATVNKYADTVLTVYRDNYYNPENRNSDFEVIVVKSNTGRLGTAILKFEIDAIPAIIRVPAIKNM